MIRREQETAEVLLTRLAATSPKPSKEFRRASWRTFQTALERYLATKRQR